MRPEKGTAGRLGGRTGGGLGALTRALYLNFTTIFPGLQAFQMGECLARGLRELAEARMLRKFRKTGAAWRATALSLPTWLGLQTGKCIGCGDGSYRNQEMQARGGYPPPIKTQSFWGRAVPGLGNRTSSVPDVRQGVA
jgi:hypothetical protein